MSRGFFHRRWGGWHLRVWAKNRTCHPGSLPAERALELASQPSGCGRSWVGAQHPALEIPKEPQV